MAAKLSDEQVLEKCVDYPRYGVSRSGVIVNLKTGRTMQQNLDNKGYWRVTLRKNSKSNWVLVHRLLATAFIPNPSKLPQINHKDGSRSNNLIDNLEWCTAQYNVRDGWSRGRKPWNKGLETVHIKQCKNCGAEFCTKRIRIQFCGKSCAAKYRCLVYKPHLNRKRNELGQLV